MSLFLGICWVATLAVSFIVAVVLLKKWGLY